MLLNEAKNCSAIAELPHDAPC